MKRWFVVFLLTAFASTSHAVPISLADFDGSETLFDFNQLTPIPSGSPASGAFISNDFSIVSASGQYLLQPFGGTVVGSSSVAYNTLHGSIIETDVDIIFAASVSKFGMLFGNSNAGSTSLSGTVSAYDMFDVLVESITFTNIKNMFVGFNFSTEVKSISIDRTDTQGRYTFIDDIRYLSSTGSSSATGNVPVPSTLLLMLTAAFSLARLRRQSR